jgi:hypothetical protein
MAALLEPIPAATTAVTQPTVILAIPVEAWRALTDLASRAGSDPMTRHHLRSVVGSVTMMDSVLCAVVMVNGDGVEVSLHTHATAADAALTGRLADRIGIIPGPGLDWRALRDGGLVPEDMMGSRVVMLSVDTARPGEEGHER